MKNIYELLQPSVSTLMKTLFNPTIEYEDEIPEDKGILLVGNHTSNLDSLLLASATKRHIHFLAKAELFKGPMKLFMNSIDSIPVNRDGNDFNAIRQAVKLLNDKKCVLIFPEGTRSCEHKTDKLILPFKKGTVIIAKKGNTDIIPFAITGDYRLVKNNLKLSFGSRINPNEYKNQELLEKLENDVKTLILKNKR